MLVMGYSSVGIVSEKKNHEFNLDKGSRVFTNSFHQEEALVDYNMCIEIPDNVDDKSASFWRIRRYCDAKYKMYTKGI